MLVIISGFRQKIGPNINYAGVGDKHKLIAHHEDSFIYVIETVFIEYMKDILTKAGRDFDVLEESLGKSQYEILEKYWQTKFNIYSEISSYFRCFECSILFGKSSLGFWSDSKEDKQGN